MRQDIEAGRSGGWRRAAPTLFVAWLTSMSPANAHPHVFVDGGVDLEFDREGQLAALRVTWLYDAFETLYILASHDLSLNAEGGLDEEDRLALVKYRSDWPPDFDGSAHLSVDGGLVAMEWPTAVDAHVIDGRLKLTFVRTLSQPLTVEDADIGFYESTYFFAFAITQETNLIGAPEGCSADIVKFDPDAEDMELQGTLAKLGREETPNLSNVGALFADRILVSCA
ncbi:MAG: DUF1007 family protein [Marinovum sp.]|nr:DUF1007 family protein [Marinovum sp.]